MIVEYIRSQTVLVWALPMPVRASLAAPLPELDAHALLQAVVLVGGATSAASLWGAPLGSALRTPTLEFLFIRGIGAPVTVLMLVLQVCVYQALCNLQLHTRALLPRLEVGCFALCIPKFAPWDS